MLFNSFSFVLFLTAVVIIHFALPHRHRWILLLAASYYFYMCWKIEYVILILLSTVVDYAAGLRMGRLAERSHRRKYLVFSIAVNLGILFLFKYWTFFGESVRQSFEPLNIAVQIPELNLLLPIGISFYTFQSMSYSIDVYRGHRKPETHLGIFALYVAFFPQLVAGPIERSTRLLPQFVVKKEFSHERLTEGIQLIFWGLFKKMVIADRLAIVVDQIYATPQEYSGFPLWIATYFFAFQIYCDFSGYSDVAIGSARILGYDLMTNFRRPYFSKSVGEFWQRWHISLSTWFRDYLYIPLGGNRLGRVRQSFNILIVFLLSGLWHGANWTFVIWGLYHGLCVMSSKFWAGIRSESAQIFITFHLVCLGWILFRSNSLSDAIYIVQNLFPSHGEMFFGALELGWKGKILWGYNIGIVKVDFVVALVLLIMLYSADFLAEYHEPARILRRQSPVIWHLFYYGMIVMFILFAVDQTNQFIYFQF